MPYAVCESVDAPVEKTVKISGGGVKAGALLLGVVVLAGLTVVGLRKMLEGIGRSKPKPRIGG